MATQLTRTAAHVSVTTLPKQISMTPTKSRMLSLEETQLNDSEPSLPPRRELRRRLLGTSLYAERNRWTGDDAPDDQSLKAKLPQDLISRSGNPRRTQHDGHASASSSGRWLVTRPSASTVIVPRRRGAAMSGLCSMIHRQERLHGALRTSDRDPGEGEEVVGVGRSATPSADACDVIWPGQGRRR